MILPPVVRLHLSPHAGQQVARTHWRQWRPYQRRGGFFSSLHVHLGNRRIRISLRHRDAARRACARWRRAGEAPLPVSLQAEASRGEWAGRLPSEAVLRFAASRACTHGVGVMVGGEQKRARARAHGAARLRTLTTQCSCGLTARAAQGQRRIGIA